MCGDNVYSPKVSELQMDQARTGIRSISKKKKKKKIVHENVSQDVEKGGLLQGRLWNTMIHFYKVDFGNLLKNSICLFACLVMHVHVCACMQPHACRSLDMKDEGQRSTFRSQFLPPS